MKRDVISALNQNFGHAALVCPVCEDHHWGGVGAEGDEPHVIVSAYVQGQSVNIGLECELLWCNRCGYVRLHAVDADIFKEP